MNLHALLIAPFGVCLAAAAHAAGSPAESITFRFAPLDGGSYVQRVDITRSKNLAARATQIDESSTRTRVSTYKTESGWRVVHEPISAVARRNGQTVTNPIVDLLSKTVVTYRLDGDGHIQHVDGYVRLIERLREQLPAEMVEKLEQVLSVESLEAKDKAEWDSRFGDFIGLTVEVGESIAASAPFVLPDGTTIMYRVTTRFVRFEPCGEARCVRVEQVYDSQADAVAQLSERVAGELVEDIAALPPPADARRQATTGSITGKVSRLVDPSTMLIHREEVERVMRMTVNLPQQGSVPLDMSERRVYQLEFPARAAQPE